MVWVRHCADGLKALIRNTALANHAADRIEAVVLDLSLPDSSGIETFDRIFQAAPQIPILVLAVTANADDACIVRTLIDTGKNLHMRVVAEGGETPEQLAFLRDGDCPFGQGYYFGLPLTGPDCTQILRRRITLNGTPGQPC